MKRFWPLSAALGMVLLLCVMLFWPVQGFVFLDWDDNYLLTENAWVQAHHLRDVVRVWDLGPAWQGHVPEYFPIRDMWYALLHWLWGLQPRPFHLGNLLLHLLNVCLVFGLAYTWLAQTYAENQHRSLSPRLSVLAAALVALWWGIHPTRVEVVAWVSASKDLLMAFFLLAGTACFMRGLRTERLRWMAGAILCLVGACLSKHVGVIGGGLWALYLLWQPRYRREKRAWGVVGLALLLGLGWGLFSLQVGKRNLHVRTTLVAQKQVNSLWVQPLVQWDNLLRQIAPIHLQPIYDPPDRKQVGSALWWLAVGMLLALGGWLVWGWLHGHWLLLWAAGWYVIGLAPYVFFQVGNQLSTDRYLYLPSVGFYLLWGWGWLQLGQRLGQRPGRWLQGAIAAALVVLFAVGTWTYLPMWRAPEVFWRGFLERAPKQAHALVGRASHAMKTGQFRAAILHLEKYQRWHKMGAQQLADLSVAYLQTKQHTQALHTIQTGLRQFPQSPLILNAAGYIMAVGGQPHKAIVYFSKAVQLQPRMFQAHLNLLRALLQTKQYKRAHAHWQFLRQQPMPAAVAHQFQALLTASPR